MNNSESVVKMYINISMYCGSNTCHWVPRCQHGFSETVDTISFDMMYDDKVFYE